MDIVTAVGTASS